jgi:hypothetical protein
MLIDKTGGSSSFFLHETNSSETRTISIPKAAEEDFLLTLCIRGIGLFFIFQRCVEIFLKYIGQKPILSRPSIENQAIKETNILCVQ